LNPIQTEENRFQKDRKLRKEMMQILNRHEKDGIAPEDFIKQVQSVVKVSRGKIFNVIKDFAFHGLIRIETDAEDRRKKRYYPNIDYAKAEVTRYKVEDFLRSIKKPQSFEFEKNIRGYHLSLSLIFEHYKEVKLDQKFARESLEPIMNMLEPFMKETKLDTFTIFVGCQKMKSSNVKEEA